MTKNYYDILNIPHDASEEEIKAAHKKAYVANHPDKFKGQQKLKAEQRCQQINEAYSVLSNKSKRAQYDMKLKGGERFYGTYGQTGYSEVYNEIDFSDFFRYHEPQYNLDLNVEIQLSLEQAYYGVNKRLQYEIYKNCYSCAGLGFLKKSTRCKNCNGSGYVQTGFFNFINRVMCKHCKGTGFNVINCTQCRGSGLIKGQVVTNIQIPAGTGPQDVLKYPKKGHMKNTKQGTLFLKVHLKMPPEITYDSKNNLFMNVVTSYRDVLFRNRVQVKFLKQHFFIRIPENYDSTVKLAISNKGLMKYGRRQNLYIILKIVFPSYLDKDSVVVYRDK